jgi:hypothetical protein
MQQAENPNDLLAEFKLATGKGQLIRANEMAAKLFSHFIMALSQQSGKTILWNDIVGKPEICDPAACACKTGNVTRVPGLETALVTYNHVTATPVLVDGSNILVGDNVLISATGEVSIATSGNLEVVADDTVEIKTEESTEASTEDAPKPRKKK